MTTHAPIRSNAIARLWATSPEALSFAPETVVRAFLLERGQGNLLIYNTGAVESELEPMRERGGVSRQYLNHSHEALFGPPDPAGPLGARVLVHERDANSIAGRGWEARYTFSRRHKLDEDFEVIPTPGHTPGATAYLWNNGAERLLFTGDSLYLRGGEWAAAVLDSSDRDDYIASLELLRGIEFDVLVPWAADAGGAWSSRVEPGEARERIDAILSRLRAGGDH